MSGHDLVAITTAPKIHSGPSALFSMERFHLPFWPPVVFRLAYSIAQHTAHGTQHTHTHTQSK